MYRMLYIVWVLMVPFNSGAQIFIDNADSDERTSTVEKDDSCSCQHLFYLINEKDFTGLKNCIDNGANINCYETAKVRDTKNTFFFRGLYIYYYFKITPFTYAVFMKNLPALKAMYKKGVYATEHVWKCKDESFSENIKQTSDVFDFFGSRIYDSSPLYTFLTENGVLSTEQKKEIDEEIESQLEAIRDDPKQLDNFQQLIKRIDSSAILVRQKHLHQAFQLNIPEIYLYLLNVQRYDIFAPYTEYHSRGRPRVIFDIFAPRGHTHSHSLKRAILRSKYPTVELIEFGKKQGLLDESDLRSIIDLHKSYFKRHSMKKGFLFRSYYQLYFELKAVGAGSKQGQLMEAKMRRIKKRLHKRNSL
jgi:hypothetical protein